jgi:hypothetical protein
MNLVNYVVARAQAKSAGSQYDQDGHQRYHIHIKADKKLGRRILYSDEKFRRIVTAAQVLTPTSPPQKNHELTSPHVLCSQVENLNKGPSQDDGAASDDDEQLQAEADPPPPAPPADAPAPKPNLVAPPYPSKRLMRNLPATGPATPTPAPLPPAAPADEPPADETPAAEVQVPEPGADGWKPSVPGSRQNKPRGY